MNDLWYRLYHHGTKTVMSDLLIVPKSFILRHQEVIRLNTSIVYQLRMHHFINIILAIGSILAQDWVQSKYSHFTILILRTNNNFSDSSNRYISDIHRNINVNPHSKSEIFKPKLEDDETINSWGLEQAVKPAESTLDTYPANLQAR